MKKSFLLITLMVAAFALNAQDSLKQYTGKYKFPEGSVVTETTVTLDSGKLVISSAQGSSELRKTSGDEFEVVAYGGTATFRRNAENKIVGVHIVVGDVDMEGTKTEGGLEDPPLSRSYLRPLR